MFTISGKNAMLDHLGTKITHVGALNASETEISTERVAITWSAAANGSMSASNQPVLSIPAGESVKHIIFMSALSGGVEYGRETYDTPESFTNAGTFTLTSITLSIGE